MIASGLCLLLASPSFSQNRSPVLIPYESDTLIGITEYQFDLVLFSFSHLQEVKKKAALTEQELLRADSVIKFMDKQFVLQAKADREKDNVIDNLEVIIASQKREMRKRKVRASVLNILLGAALAAETALIVNAAVR